MNKCCRLCGAGLSEEKSQKISTPSGTQFFSKDETAERKIVEIELVSCDACGLIQTRNDPIIYKDNSSASSFVSDQLRDHRKNQAVKLFNFQENQSPRVLEVGCGDGSFLKSITPISGSILGVEPAEKTADIARKQGINVVSLLVVEDTKIEKQDFDCFFLFHVLEHVPNILPFLRGIRNNLREGAVGCVEIPCTEAAFEAGRYGDYMPDHMSYFTAPTLRKALEISGFEVLEMERNWQGEHLVAYVKKVSHRTDVKVIGEFIEKTRDAMRSLESQLTQGKKIALWGASHHLMPILTNHGDLSNFQIFDSSAEKIDRYVPGASMRIRNPAEINPTEIQFIVVSAPRFSEEIGKLLKSKFPNTRQMDMQGHEFFNFPVFQI